MANHPRHTGRHLATIALGGVAALLLALPLGLDLTGPAEADPEPEAAAATAPATHPHTVIDTDEEGNWITTQFSLSDDAERHYECNANVVHLQTIDPGYDHTVIQAGDAFAANRYYVQGDSPGDAALVLEVKSHTAFQCG
jgi:hypothetical protein